jgi:hypothetical protein
MAFHEDFNRSAFSHFLNSSAGRIFRLTTGGAFLIVGYFFRAHPLGVVSMLWSILPLTAGGFDVCYISAVLGGPLSGRTIRERYKGGQTAQAAG